MFYKKDACFLQMAFHEDDKADVGDHAKTSSHIQVLDVDIPIVNWDVDSDQEVTSAAEPGCTISGINTI
jgi:hypothetical protein